MIKPYFQHIKITVLSNLDSAQTEILAAVAWITDKDIYTALCQAAKRSVHIILILNEDDINRQSNIEWKEIGTAGTTILWSKSVKGIMHHKFCIIDRKTVLTGSYNWTYSAANYNEESLLVMDDKEVVEQFLQEFEQLLIPFGKSLQLEEGIILSPRIAELKIKIPLLEADIALLEEKYASLSVKVEQFLLSVHRAVGNLLLAWKLLMIQRAAKRAEKTDSKADKIEHEEARQSYEQAKETFEQAKAAPVLQELSSGQQTDMKKMYREAVMLAHPDKYQHQPEKQAQANRMMAALSEAYKMNDYEKVKSFWEDLKKGVAFSLSLNEVDSLEQLEAYFKKLLTKKEFLLNQLGTLQQSDDYKNWEQFHDNIDEYVKLIKEDLEAKIRLLREEVRKEC